MAAEDRLAPIINDPVSPRNTEAGYELCQRNPRKAPAKAVKTMLTSGFEGWRLWIREIMARVKDRIAAGKESNPSIPSVILVEFVKKIIRRVPIVNQAVVPR